MGTALDLILLLAISKEAFELAPQLPITLWATFTVALPFCLGMAHEMREQPRAFILNPVRTLIGQGLTLTAAFLFLTMLAYRGLTAPFWGMVLLTTLPYALGRFLGMTLKGLLLLVVVVITMYLILVR